MFSSVHFWTTSIKHTYFWLYLGTSKQLTHVLLHATVWKYTVKSNHWLFQLTTKSLSKTSTAILHSVISDTVWPATSCIKFETINMIFYPLSLWLWCVWSSISISITVPRFLLLSVSFSGSWSRSCRKRWGPYSISATPRSTTWPATRSLVARTGTMRWRVTTSTTIQFLESTVPPSESSNKRMKRMTTDGQLYLQWSN